MIAELLSAPCHLRHIRRGSTSQSVTVLGKAFFADRKGVNGRQGFASGNTDPRLNEEGVMTVKFPNAAGEDAQLHRERFAIIRDGRPTPLGGNVIRYTGGKYRPGDEWLELWVGQQPVGETYFVGTPTNAVVTPNEITLTLHDPYWMLKKTRETAAGYWCHAPRDVFEHYTKAWQAVLADGFDVGMRPFTYSTSESTTSDGKWKYARAETNEANFPGAVRVRPNATAQQGYMEAQAPIAVGYGAGADLHWRIETTVRLDAMPGAATAYLGVGPAWNASNIFLAIDASNGGTVTYANTVVVSRTYKLQKKLPNTFRMAIEGRDRWIFYYVDNSLVGVSPMPSGAASWKPVVKIATSTDATATMFVESFLLRKCVPYLMRGSDRGDFHLPGSPAPGTFLAEYFSLSDTYSRYTDPAQRRAMAFSPTLEPYARREESLINNTAAGWHPSGPPNESFAVRYTGSIYLDLENYDYRFQFRYSGAVYINMRFGKTMRADAWEWWGSAAPGVQSGWVKANAGYTKSGWYPFVIEVSAYATTSAGTTLIFEYQRNDDASSAWTIVNNDTRVRVSPQGIVNTEVRYDSHYDQIQNLVRDWGYQFRTEPRSLESGLFPGEMVPRVRVGLPSNKVLDEIEATSVQATVAADGVADSIVADASGLGDQENQASIVVEAINYAEADQHMLLHQEYESLADITYESLAMQRVMSLLALRGSPWEEVATKSRGNRELVDHFPIPATSQLAELKWLPGDGVRLSLPSIGTVDQSERQMLGVPRDFSPDGMGPPTLAFRQRPRDPLAEMRKLARTALNIDRNYQKQIVSVTGGRGGTDAAVDAYARVSLSGIDRRNIVKAELVVDYKTDTSTWNVEVMGVVRFSVNTTGRYDVTPWIPEQAISEGRMYARLINGSGSIGYVLEIKVVV